MEEGLEAWQCHVLFDFLLPFPRSMFRDIWKITNAMQTVLSVWVIVFSKPFTSPGGFESVTRCKYTIPVVFFGKVGALLLRRGEATFYASSVCMLLVMLLQGRPNRSGLDLTKIRANQWTHGAKLALTAGIQSRVYRTIARSHIAGNQSNGIE